MIISFREHVCHRFYDNGQRTTPMEGTSYSTGQAANWHVGRATLPAMMIGRHGGLPYLRGQKSDVGDQSDL
jgi:hypothetical protein